MNPLYQPPAQNTTGDDEFFTKVRNHLLKDKRVDGNAKILLGQIEGLSRKEGHCWATNGFFAEMFGVSESTISRWVSQLVKARYITLQEDVPCKRGTERRIFMGDVPRQPRDGTPEVLTQVLVKAATTPRQKVSKPADSDDTHTQRCVPGNRNSADTPIRKAAATPIRKGAYQIDHRKEEIKENLKSERTQTPGASAPPPQGAGLQEIQHSVDEENTEKIGLAPVSASPPATVEIIDSPMVLRQKRVEYEATLLIAWDRLGIAEKDAWVAQIRPRCPVTSSDKAVAYTARSQWVAAQLEKQRGGTQ